MEREHILSEIRRTAEQEGKPLGMQRFVAETGIQPHDWERYWPRWGDAVREAGFEPNEMTTAYSRELLLEKLVLEIRHFGQMPTGRELKLRRRDDSGLPHATVYVRRLGPKSGWARTVAEFCEGKDDYSDVLEIIREAAEAEVDSEGSGPTEEDAAIGFVYLAKSGRHYKIGRTNSTGRRAYDLALQLPERLSMVHEIRTDDPVGIERYWHERFADKRGNGEWFDLSASDVAAFRRRRFQ